VQLGLHAGEFAPNFRAATATNARFGFDTMGGRYVTLSFLGPAAHPSARKIAEDFREAWFPFDDIRASAFVVAADPHDVGDGHLRDRLPGLRIFLDFEAVIARLYGMPESNSACTFVLDPMMRLIERVPVIDPARHVGQVIAVIAAQPAIPGDDAICAPAPILIVPNVFEPGFCRMLIDLFDREGGTDSGFMREQDGRTVAISDHRFKRRADCKITDEKIIAATRSRIFRRLVPVIERAFQYKVTHMERCIVACYDSEVGGFFKPHRDNTTKGTAHRRLAVSLHLNTPHYEGGALRFPEFGRQTYKAPIGAAIVFSCSLLHEATPVVAGRRYMFLPFLYDDEAAKIQARNSVYVGAAGDGADPEAMED
jgi:hypothetical protein